MNKRGWIRTLEAVIAILLIFGFILYVTPKTQSYGDTTPQIVESRQNFIMKTILENNDYRNCVLDGGSGSYCFGPDGVLCVGYREEIENLVEKNKPLGYDYACEICPSSASCTNVNALAEKSVYTSAIFVSKPGTGKVMRLYFWET